MNNGVFIQNQVIFGAVLGVVLGLVPVRWVIPACVLGIALAALSLAPSIFHGNPHAATSQLLEFFDRAATFVRTHGPGAIGLVIGCAVTSALVHHSLRRV